MFRSFLLTAGVGVPNFRVLKSLFLNDPNDAYIETDTSFGCVCVVIHIPVNPIIISSTSCFSFFILTYLSLSVIMSNMYDSA